MALLAAPAAMAGLRALGVDERTAKLGLAAAKKALPIAKGLFKFARRKHKKKNIRAHLAKFPSELRTAVPGLADAEKRHALFDQLSKINERESGVKGSMLKKAAMIAGERLMG
jgi:hypothetical protein